MSDPEYPNEDCVQVLRSTVATILKAEPSPQMLCDRIIAHLFAIQESGKRQDWLSVASQAGTIASMAMVLQLDAMSRLPPKGPMQ
jgi:hypothetical protein